MIAPKFNGPLNGTAPRNAVLGEGIAPKGQFAGAATAERRQWVVPFRGRPKKLCTFEHANGKLCGGYKIKDSDFCVGHTRRLAKADNA